MAKDIVIDYHFWPPLLDYRLSLSVYQCQTNRVYSFIQISGSFVET